MVGRPGRLSMDRKVNGCVPAHQNVRADESLAYCSPSCYDFVALASAIFGLEVTCHLPFFVLVALLSTALALIVLNLSVSFLYGVEAEFPLLADHLDPESLYGGKVLLQVLQQGRFLSTLQEPLGFVFVVVFVVGEMVLHGGEVIDVQWRVAYAPQSQCSASKDTIEFRLANFGDGLCGSFLLDRFGLALVGWWLIE